MSDCRIESRNRSNGIHLVAGQEETEHVEILDFWYGLNNFRWGLRKLEGSPKADCCRNNCYLLSRVRNKSSVVSPSCSIEILEQWKLLGYCSIMGELLGKLPKGVYIFKGFMEVSRLEDYHLLKWGKSMSTGSVDETVIYAIGGGYEFLPLLRRKVKLTGYLGR